MKFLISVAAVALSLTASANAFQYQCVPNDTQQCRDEVAETCAMLVEWGSRNWAHCYEELVKVSCLCDFSDLDNVSLVDGALGVARDQLSIENLTDLQNSEELEDA